MNHGHLIVRVMAVGMALAGLPLAAQTTAPAPSEPPIVLMWEYDHTVVIDSFLVTYRRSTDPGGVLQQFRVPWTASPTCDAMPGTHTPNDVCAQPPDCLSPGVYTMSVQAVRGTETSAPSNWASCEALPSCHYDCHQFQQANDVLQTVHNGEDVTPPPTTSTTSTTTSTTTTQSDPTTESLQQLESQLATLNQRVPHGTTTPIVATAPV